MDARAEAAQRVGAAFADVAVNRQTQATLPATITSVARLMPSRAIRAAVKVVELGLGDGSR